MWRYLVGGAAGALAIVAGMMLQATRPAPPSPLPLASAAPAAPQSAQETASADDPAVPEALPRTREQKRFDRYDKDRNGLVTREEYLQSRRKAFAKLDRDGNGMLSFDEWAIKTETKFATADKDKSGAMSPAEFATTAVKRKARPRPNCPAKPAAAAPAEETGEES